MPIINGIEVEGYEYFNGFCEKYDTDCAEKENCLYKQLQRMKAENETLKSQLDFEVQKKEVLEAENEKLKASNRNLKLNLETYNSPEVKKILTLWHTGELDLQEERLKKQEAENEKLEQENKELTHYLACMTEQRNKANTTLQKIKEIVIEPCIDGKSCETCNSNCTNKDILTLIKKVEER